MSRKIHKITRNLMMVALSLSLLLGLGFVLSPAASADAPSWENLTAGDGTYTVALFLGATGNAAPDHTGTMGTSDTLDGVTLGTGNRTLNLAGHTLTLNGNIASGTTNLTIRGPGTVQVNTNAQFSGTGDLTLGESGARITIQIVDANIANVTGTGIFGDAAVNEPGVSRFRLQSGASLPTLPITILNNQTLEIIGPTFNKPAGTVTFEPGHILYRAGGLPLDMTGTTLSGIINWRGTGTLSGAGGNHIMTVGSGTTVTLPVTELAGREAPIEIDGGTLNITNVLRTGSTLDPFKFIIGPAGGTINVTPPDDGGAGRAVLNLNPGTVFNDHLNRPGVGRALNFGGDALIDGWRESTLTHFFGPIVLNNRIEMRTTNELFRFEDGKTLTIMGGNPGARLTTGTGGFVLGSAAEGIVTASTIDNRGTIHLGGNFTVTGRSVVSNAAGATIALNNNNTFTLAGSQNVARVGTRLLNAGTISGGAGSSIVVEGGPDHVNANSGTFVNDNLVDGNTIALTVDGSSTAAVGGSVVNNGTMNLLNVSVLGGQTGTGGRGGTLDNDGTLVTVDLTVGRARSGTATGGTLNNDGYLRLVDGVVQGGNLANVDAGVLTNSEEAELYVFGGTLTLGGADFASAAAVEFTNEGWLSVYGSVGSPTGTLVIGAGGVAGAPSAQIINDGTVVLGYDSPNILPTRHGNLVFGLRVGDGSRATFVNNWILDVTATSWIRVDTAVRVDVERQGLLQNTADGIIRVTGSGVNRLPTGTFANAGIVTFTASATALTIPATDVFGDGIAIGVGPYNWGTVAGDHVPRGALPFAGLGHRQILTVYGDGGRFVNSVNGVERLNVNEVHMTAGEARLVTISVLDNFGLMPTRGTEDLVGFRNAQGEFFGPDDPVEVIGSLQPGQRNPDVVWAVWGTIPTPRPEVTFGDVSAGRWYAAAVRWAANTDPAIARGFQGTNQFGPNANLTRGQFVTMLYRLAGEPSVAGLSNPFSDVGAGRYYTNAIIWAFHNDVVRGFDGTTQFRPNVPMQRQHVATTLYRMANASPAPANALHGFPDASDISGDAVNAVNWAVANGIMGRATGTLRPLDRVSRGEAVTMIFRAAVELGLIP